MKQFSYKTILVLACVILLAISKKSNAQCDTVFVPTPIVDVRGSTDLCSGNGYLELCPSIWGFSNFKWYKDGVLFSTNSCIVITQVGSYTLMQQNSIGCWSAASNAVDVTGSASIPNTPVINTNDTTNFCQGSSANLSSSASTGNQWYKNGLIISGAVYQNYAATESGVYTVTASNCGGTSAESIGITVTVIPSPSVGDILGTNSICLGDSLQLTDTTAGGTWSSSNNSIATVDANGLVHSIAAGSVVISYTVSNGICTKTVTKNISIYSTPTASIAVNGSTILCSNSSIQLCPAVWGFSNYQWYKNGVALSTSSCINITDTGSYTLQGLGSNNCSSSVSNPVIITSGTPTATPTISVGGATTFCNGGSVVLSSSATSGNQWYRDSTAIAGATGTSYTATQSGNYTLAVTDCGTAVSSNVIVSVVNFATVTAIIGSNNLCLGDSTTLVDTTVGGSWSSSDTAIATVDSNGLVHSITAGNVIISYTVINGSCSGTVAHSISISPNQTPVIDVRGSTTLCGNATLDLCPAMWGYSNYQWYKDGIAYSTSSCINVSTSGTYTLSGLNSSGCTSGLSIPVVVTDGVPPATPTIVAGGATTFCDGGSVILSSSSTVNNQWYKDSVAIGGATSQNYMATGSGTYMVAVVGCGQSFSNTISVTVNAAPIVAQISGISTLCAGGTTTLATITSGGTWSSSDTTVAKISSTGLVNAIAPGNTIINYTVNNGTCSSSSSMYFTVFTGATTPTINPKSSLSFCDGSSVQLCPLVWGYSNYQWYKNGTVFSTASCITVTDGATYTLAGQNGAGCWSDQSATVTTVNNPLPIVDATTGSTGVCVGSSITLTNTSTTPVGGSAIWSSTAGRASVNNAGVVTGTSAGNANIRYTVTTSAGCSNSVNFAVTVSSIPAIPSIAFAVGTTGITGTGGYCKNKTFTLVGTPSGGSWSATGAFSITSGGVVTTSTTTGSGSVSYAVTNAAGCVNTRTIAANVISCGPRGLLNQSDISGNNDWIIYPNPAHNNLNITIKTLIGTGKIIVTDLLGKVISNQSLSIGTNSIDVSKFAKGLYLVNVITNDNKKTERVIIE